VERKVHRNGRQIELTTKEFALLEYLMRNAGRRITRSMIIEHVWNISFDTSTNVVDVYINYQAAAKVISTVDTLMGNLLDMGVTDPGY
jgi:DNA-binding response OmpR family regulator